MTETKIMPPKMGRREPIKVSDDEAEMRLDRWFKKHFPNVSHGQIQKALRKGEIRCDGKRAESSDHVTAGHEIRVPPPFYDEALDGSKNLQSAAHVRQGLITKSRSESVKKMVLFEDDDVIVLNKPAGLAVQGGTGLKENLDDLLLALAKEGAAKPKLVHRLDKDTSGVLLVARTDYAARQLTAAFREKETRKIYWALTLGVPRPIEGVVDAPLIRIGEVMEVAVTKEERQAAKTARTLYSVEDEALRQAAFVALWPVTGRTHQLRVHMAHLGTPILGDRFYGGLDYGPLPRAELGQGLHLHARRLIVPHPRRGKIDVTAPLGEAMRKSWKWFGFDANAKTDFDGDKG